MGAASGKSPGNHDANENHKNNAGDGHSIFKGRSPCSKKSDGCCGGHGCLKALYVILAILIVLISIILIAQSVTTAIATKIYLDSEMSGRLVALIILAVTAAATLSVVIYATIAVFRKKVKPLHAASIVLVILIIIQAVIAGVSVRVTKVTEFSLSQSLEESFQKSRDDIDYPMLKQIWAATQHGLTCCGVYSADDYRRPGSPPYFGPDVPISCCPTYDPDRSELVQERARGICKARNEFFQVGCKNYVLQIFKQTAAWVLSVTIILIILEVAEVIIGSILSRKTKNEGSSPEEGAKVNVRTEEKAKN